ncbi:probable G-protein coupled receptor Mth-like 5 [Orussus abietinus]|uniref:probable G-protein coupled receptor Mth-like 5 n=1 Tax=Orussus abietinus TaxID=222816 RepID=UPI0006251349|nr:probable G-protein coupled receptor Mth-like 5 [Orussus abietinus]
MKRARIALLLLWGLGAPYTGVTCTSIGNPSDEGSVMIAKCCDLDEILVDDTCIPVKETNETQPWRPEFLAGTREPRYRLKVGLPRCKGTEHQWHVYHYPSSSDRLTILPSGKLRHHVSDASEPLRGRERFDEGEAEGNLMDETSVHCDYEFGDYCVDKVVLSRDRLVATYAMVCVPEVAVRWTDTVYFVTHVVDPTFRAIAMASYVAVAVVYFVLPQLRDLVGNIITSMSLCLVASQGAATVRIFTEYGNHISFVVADTVMYVSLLAAFFWLNALGYYVWNTFRSRNIFLRVTDGRKYCYYSSYVWGSTFVIAVTAIFAHFTLETNKPTIGGTLYPAQETVGWLGISVLFTCIAFTIIIDLCFALTTANTIGRMNTCGRIHHKMKYSFKMYVLLFIILSTAWFFLLLSQLKYDVLVYFYIVVNFIQALLILYVCIFGQKRVTFLLGKTCNCCTTDETIEGLDWGEEMTAINAGY